MRPDASAQSPLEAGTEIEADRRGLGREPTERVRSETPTHSTIAGAEAVEVDPAWARSGASRGDAWRTKKYVSARADDVAPIAVGRAMRTVRSSGARRAASRGGAGGGRRPPREDGGAPPAAHCACCFAPVPLMTSLSDATNARLQIEHLGTIPLSAASRSAAVAL